MSAHLLAAVPALGALKKRKDRYFGINGLFNQPKPMRTTAMGSDCFYVGIFFL